MKKIILILSAVLLLVSCEKHYYDPVVQVKEYEGMIAQEGEVIMIDYVYTEVETKFTQPTACLTFRYRAFIDDEIYSYAIVTGSSNPPLKIVVPCNDTFSERNIKVEISAGKTYDLDIFFTKDGMEGETVSTSIMTKRMPSVKWPYIYFGNAERNADGTFSKGTRLPLRVYGATGAAEIGWTFNEMPIRVGGDGYYTLKAGGILKAIIFWEDGSVDKVMKEIRIAE